MSFLSHLSHDPLDGWDTRDTGDAANNNFILTLMIESSLDQARLEKVKRTGNKITARCPACAENGGDRAGNHLVIFPNGKFGCAAAPGDSEHRRRIFALVGITWESQRDLGRDQRWRLQRDREQREARNRQRLIDTAKAKRRAIIERYAWDRADVWESSPQRVDCDLVEYDPRHFLASLFSDDALLWTGRTTESGVYGRFVSRWRTCGEWSSSQDGVRIGPMVTPAVWKLDTTSRSAANVAEAPYVVLDFDGIDGVHPSTATELQAHIDASLALIRWMREGLCWDLAAILWTGGKSLHAWFHSPPLDVLDTLKNAAVPLGLDKGLVGRPEHPCRLPGHQHEKSGNTSCVLWLQEPQADLQPND